MSLQVSQRSLYLEIVIVSDSQELVQGLNKDAFVLSYDKDACCTPTLIAVITLCLLTKYLEVTA